MKKRTLWIILLLLLLIPSLTLASSTKLWVKTPNGRTVNMRSEPHTDAPVVAQVHYGAAVTSLNDFVGSAFLHCEYNGHRGFIMARYLVDHEPSPYNPPAPKPTAAPVQPVTPAADSSIYSGFTPTLYLATVTPSTPSTYVNLRWGPSKSTPTQTVYYANQPLLVIATNGTWSQVYDQNTHVSGFMMTNFLTFVSPYDPGALGAAQ